MVKYSFLLRLQSFFTKGNERTLRAKRNISISFITKVISIFLSFLIVPITLGYVGKVEYGIWMTIASIITWFNFFDIGLGNGLRNKLAEALAKNDNESAKIYISSSFMLLGGISIFMFLIFFAAAHFINWNSALNTDVIANKDLRLIVIVVFFFFCINFILKIVTSVLQAIQKYAVNDIINLLAQLLGLIAIYILVKTTHGSLLYLCMVYSGQSAIVMLIASFIFFNSSLKGLKPSFKYVNLKKAMPLLNLGFKFFISQIFYMIISQTSIIIVAQLFGPQDVTIFNLGVRYISITSMVYIMILTPFLSAFTEAYTKNDYDWIRHTIKKINLIWAIFAFGTIILVAISNLFFKLWVGNAVVVPMSLIIALAISSILNTWGATFSLFLNGVGKIQIQLYFVGIQSILFFPLSYLFFHLQLGLLSIVIVQIIYYSFNALLYNYQYKKIVNQKALGIWNK